MMPEQQDLLLKARASLKAAQWLCDGGYIDFAASRAYYAMFYVVEAFLIGKELAFSKHSAVHAAFGLHFCKTGIVPPQFFRYLEEGMVVRHSGDYGKGRPVTMQEMAAQIAHAGEFVDLAERLIGPLPPDAGSGQ